MFQKIMIVDDESKISIILSQLLTDKGYDILTLESGEEALEMVGAFNPDLILIDQNLPGMNGIETMKRILENSPAKTVIIVTTYGSIPLTVEAMKNGAYDTISKPFDNDELISVISRSLERNRMTNEISSLKEMLRDKYNFTSIIGFSPKMLELFEQMQRICETNATVLVKGESGTGKALVAKEIHRQSKRRDMPFVSVNCGTIPASLFDSELFGHGKGVFADAKEKKKGKFEQARGGTIFLDEIGELSLDAQVKLLRVMEENTLLPVGAENVIPINVRIITATNKNLEDEVKKGNFRLDILYRLNIFTITIPPLRKRVEDIPILIEHFIKKHNTSLGLNIKSISTSAVDICKDYSWPGNVCDLENAIQSAMIVAHNNVIHPDDLPFRMRANPEVPQNMDMEKSESESFSRASEAKSKKGYEAQVKVREEFETETTIPGNINGANCGMFDFDGSSNIKVIPAVDEMKQNKSSGKTPIVGPITLPESRFHTPKPYVTYNSAKSAVYVPLPSSAEEAAVNTRVRNDEILEDIRELKRSIKVLADSSLRSDMGGLPPNLAALYANLQDCGMDDMISRKVLRQLLNTLTGNEMSDVEIINKKAAELLLVNIKDVSPISLEGTRPRVITFIGPTGSGKTTTIAKLTTDFVINMKKRVSVVTIDTKRVDGVGQLKAFCRILNIPLHIVYTPSELPPLMEELKHNDVVLVDTPGAGPTDKALMLEMGEYLRKIEPLEVHITMGVSTALNEMNRIFENFSLLKPNRILFTKLDETDNYGPMLSFAILSNFPLSYVTFGQNMSGDFSKADPQHLLRQNLNRSMVKTY